MTAAAVAATAVALAIIAPSSASAACSRAARSSDWTPPTVRGAAPENGESFQALVSQLARHRVVFVGESHDRYDHHINQLELICALADQGRPLAIAMEFFQEPFQGALDAYVREHRNLERLLRESEYFQRWGFDPRLYAPILQFAARRGLPLIALNPPTQTVTEVSRGGPGALHAAASRRLREAVQRAPAAYVERLRAVFSSHPNHDKQDFERFLAVQVLWDEHMASRASDYLASHPGHRLVVLAGGGHVDFADAVPARLQGVAREDIAMVTQTRDQVEATFSAAFALQGTPLELPRPGRLGVAMKADGDGVRVGGFAPTSAARDAGVEEMDRLLAIDGQAIQDMGSVRLALWRKRPGDLVDLQVGRGDLTRSMRFALR